MPHCVLRRFRGSGVSGAASSSSSAGRMFLSFSTSFSESGSSLVGSLAIRRSCLPTRSATSPASLASAFVDPERNKILHRSADGALLLLVLVLVVDAHRVRRLIRPNASSIPTATRETTPKTRAAYLRVLGIAREGRLHERQHAALARAPVAHIVLPHLPRGMRGVRSGVT